MDDLLERAKILLKATKDLLEKQENSYYVLDLLEETVFYDGAECDGSCLKEDIDYWFDEVEVQSVTPARKKGHWIFYDKAHEHAHCSECGYGNVDLFNGRPHNYCPNCGAKMDEDKRILKYADQDTLMSAT